MFDGEQVSGVLDWEWSRIGDPMNDLAWAFPKEDAPVLDGFLSFEEACEVYEQASGIKVDVARLQFYKGITALKTVAFTAAMGRLIEKGQSSDIRYACLSAAYGQASLTGLATAFSTLLDMKTEAMASQPITRSVSLQTSALQPK